MNNTLNLLAVILLGVMLSGCIGGETRPSNFYYLSATEADQSANIARTGGVSLRLGPFTFPEYLSRPNIITRSTDNLMVVDEFDRWAGSLEDDFHRVLGTNLGSLLKTGSISVYPADSRLHAKYEIQGEINAFDGALGEKVILDVRWYVLDPDSDKAYVSKQSVIVEPVNGEGYSALVLAQSQALGKLSREIADELKHLDTMK